MVHFVKVFWLTVFVFCFCFVWRTLRQKKLGLGTRAAHEPSPLPQPQTCRSRAVLLGRDCVTCESFLPASIPTALPFPSPPSCRVEERNREMLPGRVSWNSHQGSSRTRHISLATSLAQLADCSLAPRRQEKCSGPPLFQTQKGSFGFKPLWFSHFSALGKWAGCFDRVCS